MKIIRIPFDTLGMIDLRKKTPESPEEGNSGNETTDDPSEEPVFLPAPEFELEPTPLSGRGPSLPEGIVAFDVPADDMPRVSAWFSGNYQGVTRPASATLMKNLTSAVHSLLDDFYQEISDSGLFAAPFRLRWRWRLKDGSVYQPGDEELMVPASTAPLLVIRDYGLGDTRLTTYVIIRQMPSRLMVKIPPLGNNKDSVAGIEFFATSPVEMFSKDAAANGVRSADVDDSRVRIWHYDAPSESTNILKAQSDEKFSFLGAIPLSLLSTDNDATIMSVPIDGVQLTDTPGSGGSGNDDPSQPPLFEPFFFAETPPLDLGDPEAFKRVTALYLRGIFPRSSSGSIHPDMELSLFGSIHRENWRLLARASGPYIRGLRGIPCRWFKARIRLTLRPGDTLHALTFISFS